MYKLKDKYKAMVAKYSMKTSIDINGVYDLKTWNENGFDISILEYSL
jgi:hypothetical protein